MNQPTRHQFLGVAYSYKNGVDAPPCSWSFWLLHRSKKVWFRIPDQDRALFGAVSFAYKGHRIRFSGDIAARSPAERAALGASDIIWGKHVKNGWGEGPRDTNYYLSIWTRWSLVHPAQCHPEWFTVSYSQKLPQ